MTHLFHASSLRRQAGFGRTWKHRLIGGDISFMFFTGAEARFGTRIFFWRAVFGRAEACGMSLTKLAPSGGQ
ncbi:MAG: hypothetical protein HXX10_20145 [Rhodoplanes sp.]|uniref:hypothetical protein n=1 Tax=Rhodoplanes sp. TaxID=1968906 RepID=UPI0017A92FE2|nr:hypothetical protein [Rhodoplanes sp.]NVO16347.1 hypothetical protein [Rhodoplanes sp.]